MPSCPLCMHSEQSWSKAETLFDGLKSTLGNIAAGGGRLEWHGYTGLRPSQPSAGI